MQNYLLWQMVKMTCSMSKVLDVFDQTEPELSEVNLGLDLLVSLGMIAKKVLSNGQARRAVGMSMHITRPKGM